MRKITSDLAFRINRGTDVVCSISLSAGDILVFKGEMMYGYSGSDLVTILTDDPDVSEYMYTTKCEETLSHEYRVVCSASSVFIRESSVRGM